VLVSVDVTPHYFILTPSGMQILSVWVVRTCHRCSKGQKLALRENCKTRGRFN
jgi:hypothetical protein